MSDMNLPDNLRDAHFLIRHMASALRALREECAQNDREQGRLHTLAWGNAGTILLDLEESS